MSKRTPGSQMGTGNDGEAGEERFKPGGEVRRPGVQVYQVLVGGAPIAAETREPTVHNPADHIAAPIGSEGLHLLPVSE